MPRIILSAWHGGRPPGTELEVDDAQLAALRRDGRVAAVVEDQPDPAPAPAPVPDALPEPADDTPPVPEPGPESGSDGPVKPGRRRR